MSQHDIPDAQICQMAAEDVSERLQIKFVDYPDLGSKFAALCEEEAFDEIEFLIEDVAEGFEESVILQELNDDITIQDEDKEPICKFIHHILSNFSPSPTLLNLVEITCVKVTNKDIQSIKTVVEQQVPLLDDDLLLKTLVVGQQYNFPLLTYLVDAYARYRLLQYLKKYQKLRENWDPMHFARIFRTTPQLSSFFQRNHSMKILRKKSASDADSGDALTLYETSMQLWFRRFLSPLKMNPREMNYKINDSLYIYAKYYIAMLMTVDNMLKSSNTKLPLQIDFWVIPKAMQYEEPLKDGEDDDDDDDDFEESEYEEDDTDDDDDDNDTNEGIHNLKKRLKHTDNLVTKDIKKTGVNRISRTLFEVCSDVIKGRRSKRMVLVIDRRDNNIDNVDKLYAFLPKHGDSIPIGDYLQESMLYLSRIEVLPSENGQVKPAYNNAIHATSDLANLCLLSIHIHAENLIRAYWYINGSYTRWFVNDIITIWPLYFIDKYNLFFIENAKYAKILVSGYIKKYCNISMAFDIIMLVHLFYGIIQKNEKLVPQSINETVKLIKDKLAYIPLRDANFDAFFETNTKLKPINVWAQKLK